ncbi:MAG TPA: hypothetical protein VMS22_26495, partial [Candidatus Eisenbacteria bacterium]|nr:hypothetical protein [Candidatus Eisenbacteria bacterium]
CRDVCRAETGCAAGGARTRTIATVVNQCHASGGTWTARQRLDVHRDDCPAVTVTTVEATTPAVDFGLCQIYGDSRDGAAAMSIGVFQGVAVSPDGGTVIFQVTDDFLGQIPLPSPAFALASEGIFVVHSDGSGLRRVRAQSRWPPFAVRTGPLPPGVRVLVAPGFSFNPDGRSVVYTDVGPGSDGSEAPQIFTLDVRTGERRQVTVFTAASIGPDPNGNAVNAVFLDDDRIGGFVYDSVMGPRLFTVRRDGSDFKPFEPPVAIPGAHLVADFHVSGLSREITSLALDTVTDTPQPGPVREVFVRDGENVLQLTNIGRSDTIFSIGLGGGHQVLFATSGDPLRQNPTNTCQLFTIDRLGGHMRQLTRFHPDGTSPVGCFGGYAPPGCSGVLTFTAQDPRTGAIVFDSSCDPFGISAIGQQLFTIRPKGSGFRQITAYRGVTTDPDGTVDVELPGPTAYSAPSL